MDKKRSKGIRLSYKIGTFLALAHFTFFVIFVRNIIIFPDAQWELEWFTFLPIDFPISLLLFPLRAICPDITVKFLSYPLSEIRDFWLESILFGLFGTIWYFFLPILIAKIFRKLIRPKVKEQFK